MGMKIRNNFPRIPDSGPILLNRTTAGHVALGYSDPANKEILCLSQEFPMPQLLEYYLISLNPTQGIPLKNDFELLKSILRDIKQSNQVRTRNGTVLPDQHIIITIVPPGEEDITPDIISAIWKLYVSVLNTDAGKVDITIRISSGQSGISFVTNTVDEMLADGSIPRDDKVDLYIFMNSQMNKNNEQNTVQKWMRTLNMNAEVKPYEGHSQQEVNKFMRMIHQDDKEYKQYLPVELREDRRMRALIAQITDQEVNQLQAGTPLFANVNQVNPNAKVLVSRADLRPQFQKSHP
jgi:hypothetical protein